MDVHSETFREERLLFFLSGGVPDMGVAGINPRDNELAFPLYNPDTRVFAPNPHVV